MPGSFTLEVENPVVELDYLGVNYQVRYEPNGPGKRPWVVYHDDSRIQTYKSLSAAVRHLSIHMAVQIKEQKVV